MTQYRQWLHYREISQHLQSQLAALQQRLAQLEEQARLLEHEEEQGASLSENVIIQALLHYFYARESSAPVSPAQASSLLDRPALAEQSMASVSPALFAWGRLPNFTSQDMQEPISRANTLSPVPSTPDSDQHLLPEDMAAFVDAHSQTAPRLELPWWLANAALSSGDQPPSKSPVDQQSVRTNRLVQRWFERWAGQHSHTTQDAQEENQES